MSGYSGTPLISKLGIKPGYRVWVENPPAEYWNWLSPLPETVTVPKTLGTRPFDFIHLFVYNRKTFEKELIRSRKFLNPEGMIWVSWPKKASGVVSDLDENVIRNFALKHRLVDIKVCSVDDTWSGLKLVIPVKDRK